MKKTLRGVALLLALTLAVTPLAAALTPAETKALLEENYVDQLPQAAKDAATIEDILKALGDPYTQYFSPEEYKAFTGSMLDSDMVGLGIQFSVTPDGGELLRVFAGSAAEKAGLVPGDLILSVNGTKLAGKTAEEVQPLMLGEVGSTVILKVRHKDDKTETLTLKRTTYTVPATDAELVDGHIGYITCTTFGGETYGHFNDAITQNDAAADRWIVDLRGNLGGDVQAAVDATSAFTGGGDLAYVTDKTAELSSFHTDKKALTIDPVIVLVDENSASSSELFAAAVRDRQAGILIGSRTYGKGVAQIVRDKTSDPTLFADGSAMKITAYRDFSQKMLTHDGVGVIPHLLVSPENAAQVAYLLSASSPKGESTGSLRLHIGTWRLYLDLKTAADDYYHKAFVELLEALPPSTDLFLGTGVNQWQDITVAEVAAKYAPTYRSRHFSDVAQSPYADQVNALATFDIVNGSGDGTYKPLEKLDRASLCALLAQAMGYEKTEGPSRFADVPQDAWYTPYVNTLTNLGIVNGWDDGLFHPAEPMNHQQLMVLLSRTAARLSLNAAGALKEGGTAEDLALYPKYDQWAKNYVWLLDGTYYDEAANIDPFASTTREEAAACLYNMMTSLGVLVG